ncbi:hypothetical protein Tco_1098920 [Tanacetum coccineum]
MMFNVKVEKVMQKLRKTDIQGRMTSECKECSFDSKEDEVVPEVDDVSLVDGVFDGAFGGDGDEDFAIEDGV